MLLFVLFMFLFYAFPLKCPQLFSFIFTFVLESSIGAGLRLIGFFFFAEFFLFSYCTMYGRGTKTEFYPVLELVVSLFYYLVYCRASLALLVYYISQLMKKKRNKK